MELPSCGLGGILQPVPAARWPRGTMNPVEWNGQREIAEPRPESHDVNRTRV